jgi:hypothetical protein
MDTKQPIEDRLCNDGPNGRRTLLIHNDFVHRLLHLAELVDRQTRLTVAGQLLGRSPWCFVTPPPSSSAGACTIRLAILLLLRLLLLRLRRLLVLRVLCYLSSRPSCYRGLVRHWEQLVVPNVERHAALRRERRHAWSSDWNALRVTTGLEVMELLLRLHVRKRSRRWQARRRHHPKLVGKEPRPARHWCERVRGHVIALR